MAVENVFRSLLNFKYHKLKKVLSNSYYQDLNFKALFWAPSAIVECLKRAVSGHSLLARIGVVDPANADILTAQDNLIALICLTPEPAFGPLYEGCGKCTGSDRS